MLMYALLREAVVSASAPLKLKSRSDVRKWYVESKEERKRGGEEECKRGSEDSKEERRRGGVEESSGRVESKEERKRGRHSLVPYCAAVMMYSQVS
jgi:hypothetical protein